MICVFGSNGDAPWQSGFDGQQLYPGTCLVAVETCYPEDGFIWTEFAGTKLLRLHIRRILKEHRSRRQT